MMLLTTPTPKEWWLNITYQPKESCHHGSACRHPWLRQRIQRVASVQLLQMPPVDRQARCIEPGTNPSLYRTSTTQRVQTNRQTEQDEVKTYMRAIILQQDDNLLQATGCGTNCGPRIQDHLLSLLTLETEILNHPGRIEAGAAVRILEDPDSEVGLIMIPTTTNNKLDEKRTDHTRASMGQEWVIDQAAGGDIISMDHQWV